MVLSSYDVLILGAGAAGMMCAIEAGRRGRSVLVMDHAPVIGKKILISGGGRCNFTNVETSPAAYVSQNPHFCKSALSRYTPKDFIAMIEAHGIAYHEKKLGQLFCDISARSIVAMLVNECGKAGAVFRLGAKIISVEKDGDRFIVKTDQDLLTASSVVVATGGLSVPKVGASGLGYDIARHFGLEVIPTDPALDGFMLPPALQKDLEGLSGVSLDVIVTCGGVSFRENILFTHRGLSGPAALQASLYWKPGEVLHLDLLPERDAAEWLSWKKKEGSRAEVKNLLGAFYPKSFAERFAALYFPSKLPLVQISDQALKDLGGLIKDWKIMPEATIGYQKAEVTRGGVSTDELSSKRMESKKIPGLYFIGEVVDVTGRLGGYNFQWAWASGWAAGQCV